MKKIILLHFSLLSLFSFAQIRQGESTVKSRNDIKQGESTVYRKYEPNVEAIEKIKQTPKVEIPTSKQQEVNYNPKDIEVASEFETTSIQIEEIEVNSNPYYNNYVRLGYGNNANLKADAFFSHDLDTKKTIGANASYQATNPSIKNTITDTNESKFDLEGFFHLNFEESKLNLSAGGNIHRLNLYGISPYANYKADDKKDVSQRYINFNLNGNYKALNDNILRTSNLKFSYLTDKFDNNESLLNLDGTINSGDLYEIDAMGGVLMGAQANMQLDFANSQFVVEDLSDNFSYLLVGTTPQLSFKNENFSLLAGINAQYINASEKDNSKFHLFPNLQLEVKAIPEFTLYGGLTGGAKLNTFHSLYQQNPYLFVKQDLKPTIDKMNFYAGIKGDWGDNFKYNAKAGFQQLENLLLFKKAFYTIPEVNEYSYSNSFKAFYANANRSYIEGQLNFVGIDNLDIGGYIHYQLFSDLEGQEYAWLKPDVKAGLNAQYKLLNEQLILGSHVFFVSNRIGEYYLENSNLRMNHIGKYYLESSTLSINRIGEYYLESPIFPMKDKVNLGHYIDINLNAEYLLNDQWSIFVEGNNLLNSQYYRFTDYAVQGINVIGGFQFKF